MGRDEVVGCVCGVFVIIVVVGGVVVDLVIAQCMCLECLPTWGAT